MIEPHPPHSTPHSWKDFFIHIAVVVIGLLIAIGLEQSVEAMHHHRERQRLAAGLRDDTEKMIRDSARAEHFTDEMLVWVRGREQALSDAAHDKRPIAALQPFPAGSLDLPDEPVYRLAKASGKLELLSEEEAAAYGELDVAYGNLSKAYDQWNEATQQSLIARRALQYGMPAGEAAYAHASPEEMLAAYKGYLAQERGMLELRLWCRQLHDAAEAVSHGERDVWKIQAEEHRRQDLP